MTDHVEQATCGRTALCEVVRPAWVDVALPEVVVFLCKDAVVDAREFAVDAEYTSWLDACMCWHLGIEDPAIGVGYKLVALEERGWGRSRGVWGEEEKDIV